MFVFGNLYKYSLDNLFMILGRICGKVTTSKFRFEAEGEPQNFEYVQVFHKRHGYVLGQIYELVRDSEKLIAKCLVIGYKNDSGNVVGITDPFQVGSEVLYAEDDFVKSVVQLNLESGGFIGKLKGRDISVYLDLQKLLTKHLAVLAKSGAGKSYFVGVLLEEIIERKVPLLLIDTHGEYSSLKYKNQNSSEISKMAEFDIKPMSYQPCVVEFGNTEYNPDCRPLKLLDQLTPQEIVDMLPSKLSTAQETLLYTVMKDIETTTFDDLIYLLELEESPVKNQVINVIQILKRYDIFSPTGVDFNELIQSGRCSIINLRGVTPDVQEILVSKLLNDLFELRKKNKVPPFFCVIEEAHNFCPERSFGQTKSSSIIRNIASEGRKFGLGLGVVSQRPARVDKSVLSQVTTQAILKVTNPNDLKAIMNSVEGVSSESEDEIRNLPIGSSMITGVVDMPLFVNVRPRKSQHGGVSVDILGSNGDDEEADFFESLEEFNEEEKEILPVIMPGISSKDVAIMNENLVERVDLNLIPCAIVSCKEKDSSYTVLVERINGEIVMNVDDFSCGVLPKLHELGKSELKVLENAFYLKDFSFEDFVSKFGGNLDVRNVLDFLVNKEYLLNSGERYSLNSRVILSNLSSFNCFNKVEYKKVPYLEKRIAKLTLDQVKELLNSFVEVVEIRECFLGVYSVVEK